MRIDAGLLKDILEVIADSGYSRSSINSDEIEFEGVPEDKLNYHLLHLVDEDYLDADLVDDFDSDRSVVMVTRITDKGMLMLNTVESSAFQKWVKEQSGEAAETLWKTSAGIAWAYAREWLAKNGLHLPG